MARAAGVILAGGAATRSGGEKALLPFLAGTLLDAVIGRVESQVSVLALNVPRDWPDRPRARYANYPLLHDSSPNRVGPLAGVLAGLEWLQTSSIADWLATFPCDTPFLPRDLVARLSEHAGERPVFAHDGTRLHGVCALWPVGTAARLRAGVVEGRLRSIQSAIDELNGEICTVAADALAFFNINTRNDLAEAEALARKA